MMVGKPSLPSKNSFWVSINPLREECSAFSRAQMRDCLAKKAGDSQKALKQIADKVVGVLSTWDEDDKYIRLAKDHKNEQKKETKLLGGG